MAELTPIFQGSVKPFIGAHRGASAYCPENTLASFKKAYELHADLIELDVQLSKDGQIVVFHDFMLDSKTDDKGLLRDRTLSELKKLDVGTWFSENFSGERIPTLEEVLSWAKDKIWLNIELKQIEHFQEPLAKKVVQLIEYYKMEEHVQIISFNHSALAEVRKFNKKIMTCVISGCRIDDPVSYLRELEAQVYNSPWFYLSKELVEDIHRAGLYVSGGMIEDSKIMQMYQDWKVDEIDTNMPDVMIVERDNYANKC